MSNDDEYDQRFMIGIIVMAVVVHLLIMLIICYFVCCRKNDRPPPTSITGYGGLSRRHSVGANPEYLRRQAEQSRRNVRTSGGRSSTSGVISSTGANPTYLHRQIDQSRQNIGTSDGGRSYSGGSRLPAFATAGVETAPVTNLNTSLFSRVRSQLGWRGRQTANPSPLPPSYDVSVGADGGGVTNPGAELGPEGIDLPSYEGYLQRLPPYYGDVEPDFDEDKPPAYEDVVKVPPGASNQ